MSTFLFWSSEVQVKIKFRKLHLTLFDVDYNAIYVNGNADNQEIITFP